MREQMLLRQFLLSRVHAGVDLRWLLLAHAAQIGLMVGTCTQNGYLESTIDQVIATIRHNALLTHAPAGNA